MFAGYCNGWLRSFDIATGALEWAYDIKKDRHQFAFHSPMLPLDDVLIAGTENPEGYIYAFERDTCRVRWKRFCGRGVFAAIVGDKRARARCGRLFEALPQQKRDAKAG